MKLAIIIGIGGFIGSISRYYVHLALLKIYPITFPIGTFAVNMIGSFLLGVVFAFSENYKLLTDEWRLFLAVGFCGSFTTFSTFAVEGLTLLQQKDYLIFTLYILSSIVLGVLCSAAGYLIFNK